MVESHPLRKQFEEDLSKILAITSVQEEVGYKEDFKSIGGDVKKIVTILSELANYPFETLLPISIIAEIDSLTSSVLSDIGWTVNYSPDRSSKNPQQIIHQFRETTKEVYSLILPVLALASLKSLKAEELNNIVSSEIDKIEAKTSSFVKQIEDKATEIDNVLKSVREAAEEVGVSQHAKHFKDEANENRIASYIWLGVTILFGVGAIALGVFYVYFFFMYERNYSSLSYFLAIQLAVAKLIIFSIVAYMIVWAGNNYRAHRHNYIVNKHRQNALSTFLAFVKSTEDENTKNTLLIKSAETIFSPAISGYISKEREQHSNPQIMEIFRSVEDMSK